MKNMIKTAVTGAVAAAFVASVAVASQQAAGQQNPKQPKAQQGRRGGPGGPGGPGRGFGGPMLAELTEQQREQVKAIHEAERDGQQGPPADAKLRQQLELELLADAPNDQAIETLKQQIATAQLEQLTRHIAVQKQITQVLTPEQRAKARERIAQAPADGRGGPGRVRRGGGFGSRH